MPRLSENLRRFDDTFGQNGMWCVPNRVLLPSTTVAGASTYRAARFVPRRTLTVVKIGFVTTVAATNDDAVDVGIFDATGARLVSSGATTGKANASAGPQTISITSTTLTAGTVYYVGFAYGTVGGTAATVQTLSLGAAATAQMFGTTAGTVEVVSAAGATLPATMTTTASSTAFNLAVLES